MKNLKIALRALYPIAYIRTHNDLEVVKTLGELHEGREVRIFHPFLDGTYTPTTYVGALQKVRWPENMDPQKRLQGVLEEDPKGLVLIYAFFQADALLWDLDFQDVLRLLYMQREIDPRMLKQVLLIGGKGEVPDALQPYVRVVREMAMTPEAIATKVEEINNLIFNGVANRYNIPEGPLQPGMFEGVRTPMEIEDMARYVRIRVQEDTADRKPVMTVAEYIKEFKWETQLNKLASETAGK